MKTKEHFNRMEMLKRAKEVFLSFSKTLDLISPLVEDENKKDVKFSSICDEIEKGEIQGVEQEDLDFFFQNMINTGNDYERYKDLTIESIWKDIWSAMFELAKTIMGSKVKNADLFFLINKLQNEEKKRDEAFDVMNKINKGINSVAYQILEASQVR